MVEIIRHKYLNKIQRYVDDDLIKIITGIRRCGKSTILKQIFNNIRKNTDKVIYLDFEDKISTGDINDWKQLIDFVKQHTNSDKYYLFFDEIQNIIGWEIACQTLRLHHSVFITGSNSKLLSREFTKKLSGRYISFKIQPFIYKEIQELAKLNNKTISIDNYLIWGGMPKRFMFDANQEIIDYLKELDQTIIFNDLINRYKIKNSYLFTKVVNFILLSNARVISARSIEKFLKNQNIKCSINTISSYLKKMQEAYIINPIKLYSKRAKRELIYLEKTYDEDVGFSTIRQIDDIDLSHNLENIVLNELEYRNYSVYNYTSSSSEIDFVAIKQHKKILIQVCLTLNDKETRHRELKAFDEFDNSYKKIIISKDSFDYSTSTVLHIKLEDFLQMEDL